MGSLDGGWVLMVDSASNTYLFNPFSRAKTQLPLLSTLVTSSQLPDIRFKVILNKNSLVAVILITFACYCWPKNLVFCEIYDDLQKPSQLENQSYFDIICINDQIHALSTTGKIDIWDFLNPFPKKTIDFGSFPIVPPILDPWLPLTSDYKLLYRIANFVKSSLSDKVLIVYQIIYIGKFFNNRIHGL